MIREYRPEDDDAILAVYREAVAAGESFPPSEPPSHERMREVWVDEKSLVLVAELGDVLRARGSRSARPARRRSRAGSAR